MLMNRNKIKRLIFESFVKHDRYLMSENFYLYDPAAANDPTHDKGWSLYQPLAEKIVDYLADAERLPRLENRLNKPRIVASGAEGIVVSLDDYKVVKLFHTIDNAAKNLNLVSRSPDKTAKVYSKGVPAHPSAQPSVQPSAQPSAQPAAQPVAQPFATASCTASCVR